LKPDTRQARRGSERLSIGRGRCNHVRMSRRRPNPPYDDSDPPHDDSAWPREAFSVSLLVVSTCLIIGVICAGDSEKPVPSLVFLVLALLFGVLVMVIPLRSWLAGGSIPSRLGIAVVAVVFGGGFVFNRIFDSRGIPLALFGVVAGMMLGNIWAMHAARANRPRRLK
jgi:hypothetical protein